MSSQAIRKTLQETALPFEVLLGLLSRVAGLAPAQFLELSRHTLVQRINRRALARDEWYVQISQVLECLRQLFHLECSSNCPEYCEDIVAAIQYRLKDGRETAPCGDVKELLFSYSIGTLSGYKAVLLRRHTAQCRDCGRQVLEMTQFQWAPMDNDQCSPWWGYRITRQ